MPSNVVCNLVAESCILILGGVFKYFLFSPLPGEMIQFDEYFSKGLNPPTNIGVWEGCKLVELDVVSRKWCK